MKMSLERFYPLLVFLFAVLLYVNTIPNAYNLDDELVTKNHRTTSKGFGGISAIFSGFYYEDEMGYKYGYRPVTQLTFAIEHELLGESPQISHTINVILYGALCTLIFVLLLKIAPTRGPTFALIVSLIFVVHPIHTEAVASIKNRDEILSLLFALSAWLLVFQGVKNRPIWQNIIWMILASLCYYLSIFSKLSTLFVVVSLPLYFALFKSFKKELVVFIVFATMFAGYRIFEQIETIHILLLFTFNVFFLLVVRLVSIDQEESIQKVNQLLAFIHTKKFTYLVLGMAYISLVLAVAFGQSWLFVLSLLLTVGFLYSVIEQNGDNFLYFAWSFPILVCVIIFYKIALIALPFFVLYSFTSSVKPPKKVVKEFVYFLGLSLVNVWLGELIVAFAVVPVLFQLNEKFKKYVLTGWLIFIALLFIDFPIVLVLFLLFSLLITLKLFETYKDKFWLTKLSSKHLLFMIIIVMFHNHLTVKNSSDLKRAKMEKIEIPLKLAETDKFESSDRPLTFTENPIVDNWKFSNRLALSLNTNTFYLKKLIFPFPFSFYYGYNQIEVRALDDWHTMGSIVVVVMLMALGLFLLIKGERLAFFALLWMELAILLYSNFFTPVAGIVGERLTFTASFGIAILGALLIQFFLKNKRLKIPVLVLFSFLVLGAAYTVLNRNQNWKDKLSLFTHDIPHLNKSAQANALLAYAYMEDKGVGPEMQQAGALAAPFLEKAIEIYPDFFNWHFDLGRIYFFSSNYLNAKASFERAIELDSSYTETYEFLMDIANLERNTKDLITYSEKVLATKPNDLDALFNLSTGLYYNEEFYEVLEVNDKIINVNSNIPEAYLNKAYAYAALEDWEAFDLAFSYGKLLAPPNHPDVSKLQQLKKNAE